MPPIRKHRFGKLAHSSLIVAGSNTPGLKSGIVTTAKKHLNLSLNLPADGSIEIARFKEQLQLLGIEVEILA
jgi:hypothetical protein